DVETAKALDERIDHGPAGLGIGDVTAEGDGLAALAFDRFHDLLGGIPSRVVVDADGNPAPAELFGDRSADSGAGARHQGGPLLQSQPVLHAHPPLRRWRMSTVAPILPDPEVNAAGEGRFAGCRHDEPVFGTDVAPSSRRGDAAS